MKSIISNPRIKILNLIPWAMSQKIYEIVQSTVSKHSQKDAVKTVVNAYRGVGS